jgi:hypothetical protein
LQHETFEEVKRRAPCVYVVYAVTYYIQAGPLDPVVLFVWICTSLIPCQSGTEPRFFFPSLFRSFVRSFLSFFFLVLYGYLFIFFSTIVWW